MEPMSVDQFIETRVLPEFHPVVAMIRGLMGECAPEAQELISYGIPAYRLRRIIAVISPTKKDITFAFSRGSEFEDTVRPAPGRWQGLKARKNQEA